MTLRRALIAAGALTVLGIVFLAVTRRPMVFAFSDPSELQSPLFSVPNPFREKGPENAAEAILGGLQRGELSALDAVRAPGVSEDIRGKEREYPLRRWKLVNRKDDGDLVTLVYRTARVTDGKLDSPVVIVVETQAGGWVVTSFSPVY